MEDCTPGMTLSSSTCTRPVTAAGAVTSSSVAGSSGVPRMEGSTKGGRGCCCCCCCPPLSPLAAVAMSEAASRNCLSSCRVSSALAVPVARPRCMASSPRAPRVSLAPEAEAAEVPSALAASNAIRSASISAVSARELLEASEAEAAEEEEEEEEEAPAAAALLLPSPSPVFMPRSKASREGSRGVQKVTPAAHSLSLRPGVERATRATTASGAS